MTSIPSSSDIQRNDIYNLVVGDDWEALLSQHRNDIFDMEIRR